MKRILKNLIALLLSVSFLFCITSFANAEDKVFLNPSVEYETVAQNSNYLLLVKSKTGSFKVCNIVNGETVLNSEVTKETYSEFDTSGKVWRNYMQSIIAINYITKKNLRANASKAYSGDSNNKCICKKTGQGFLAEYDFTSAGIKVAVSVKLDNNGLSISIPFDSIKETGNFSLQSVELLPFIGAASNDENGYIMYPDGNGALSYFNKAEKKHQYTTSHTVAVYQDHVLEELLDSKNATAMLPVYGIKNENTAFLAAITKGESSADILINTASGNASLKLNYACFRFIYTDSYRFYLSNITSNGKNTAKNLYGSKLDNKMIKGDRNVKIFFLNGEDADYSGMARVYRKYLLENNLLKDSENKNKISLRLFMGAIGNKGIFKRLVTTTTFKQANKIIDDYVKDGVSDIELVLRGWNRKGYGTDDTSFLPAFALGGKKELKKLISSAEKNGTIYLESSFVTTSKKNNVVISGSSVPVTDKTGKLFLKSPKSVLSIAEKFVDRASNFGAGIAIDEIGSLIYKDYRKKSAVDRQQTVKLWQKSLSSAENSVAVEGGNLYALKYADSLYGIPSTSSMSQIADAEIPFYSMVVFGSVPMTGDIGNMACDYDICKLKWIEYGFMPCFELTYKNPQVLSDTKYNLLFSSQNSDWRKSVTKIYKEFSDNFSCISDTYIKSHIRIDDKVKLEYENGTVVYLNYGDQETLIEGISIPAKGYAVKEGKS